MTLKKAQQIAYKIWLDGHTNGWPTEKGVKDIVKKTWAKLIMKEFKSFRRSFLPDPMAGCISRYDCFGEYNA